MKVGEALVRLLEAYGVDTVFGIPGTHSLELYRGLAQSGILHISPRHEQGGGFMAGAYARRGGKPGVCFVITGPGVTNDALKSIGKMPALRSLSITNSSIDDRGLAHLNALPLLDFLSIRNATVSDAGLRQLKTVENLKRVMLSETAVTEDGVRAFQDMHPDVEVTNRP